MPKMEVIVGANYKLTKKLKRKKLENGISTEAFETLQHIPGRKIEDCICKELCLGLWAYPEES